MEIVNKDNIGSILLSGESNTVQFKSSVKSIINVLPRNISAFANTEGGVIILGYDERSQSIIGTSSDDFEIVKRVILKNKLEDVCNAYIVQYEEKTLIIIQVKKSNSILCTFKSMQHIHYMVIYAIISCIILYSKSFMYIMYSF